MIRAFIQHDFNCLMHRHEFYELNIITDGYGMHYIEDERFRVKRGQVYVIPPMVKHGYLCGKGLDVFHLHIHPDYFKQNYNLLKKLAGFDSLFRLDTKETHSSFTTYIELSDDEFEKIYNENIISVCEFIHTYDLKNMIRAMSEATLLIVALCESCARSLSLMSAKDRGFVESLSYIIENISKKIRVIDLARVAKMSRTAYFNYFLKETGQTPAVYIMNKRLELACSRLKSTDRSIEDIATDVGFCERAYLIKCFKKRYGMTPTEYRRKNSVMP
ncbi:MAG: AraC family transcriptional regulator [Clostridia bacterium]|nr:AraC family transcriptional regulator [Clostridia bacterium]